MFDSNSFFAEYNFFPRALDEDNPRERIIYELVDQIWVDFDTDHSGYLNKDETREFLKTIQKKIGIKKLMNEQQFNQAFSCFDKNFDRKIEKVEMVYFIQCVTGGVIMNKKN